MSVKPFKINISQKVLDDSDARLATHAGQMSFPESIGIMVFRLPT
jgi:hypothetical protein